MEDKKEGEDNYARHSGGGGSDLGLIPEAQCSIHILVAGWFQKQKFNLQNQVADITDRTMMQYNLRRLQCPYQCIAVTCPVASYGHYHFIELKKNVVESFMEPRTEPFNGFFMSMDLIIIW